MAVGEYVYHWTHRKNLRGIAGEGLNPKYATGKIKLVWACEPDRIGWALLHVCERHGWNPDDMILLRVQTGCMTWRRSAWQSVYNCASLVPPDMLDGVRMHQIGQFMTLPVLHAG